MPVFFACVAAHVGWRFPSNATARQVSPELGMQETSRATIYRPSRWALRTHSQQPRVWCCPGTPVAEGSVEGRAAGLSPRWPFLRSRCRLWARDCSLSVGAESGVVNNQGVEATRATDALDYVDLPAEHPRPPGRPRRGQSASRHKRFSSFARPADTPGELQRLACDLRAPGQGPRLSINTHGVGPGQSDVRRQPGQNSRDVARHIGISQCARSVDYTGGLAGEE